VERKRLIGIVNTDAEGNYFIAAEGKAYKVLLASITYFKVEPGDEVTLVIPRDLDSDWASIENVLQKGRDNMNDMSSFPGTRQKNIDDILNEGTVQKEKPDQSKMKEKDGFSVLEEWTPDIEELKKELRNDSDK
jgi:hypothetical protein